MCIYNGGVWAAQTRFVPPYYRHITDAPYYDESISDVLDGDGDRVTECSDVIY